MRSHLRATRILAMMFPLGLALGPTPGIGAVGSDRPTRPSPVEELEATTPEAELQGWHGDRRSCSRTARVVLRACRNEVQDDYWIAFGKCLNLADEDERKQCLAEAEEARSEATKLSGEQYEARQEVCELLGQGPYDPVIDPDDFRSPEQAAADPHPYFPLVPGTKWRYVRGDETVEIEVTGETIEILGVTCFVIKDIVRENGSVVEDTDDWYAMHEDGAIWYFGEHTETWEDGVIASLDGSWKAGVDDGKAGIIMKAAPHVGDVYRQEFLLGEVEDLGQVLSTRGDESVPAASCNGTCVVTRDFTPVEPGNEGHKYYTRDVGLMLEVFPETGEREQLVEFIPGGASQARAALTKSGPGASALLSELRVGRRAPSIAGAEWSIRFDLARDADVDVEVYDSAGRRIRSIFRGRHDAGNLALEWNGTDGNDQRVANGVYFVRVRAGAEMLSRKVVVLRAS